MVDSSRLENKCKCAILLMLRKNNKRMFFMIGNENKWQF